MGGRDNLDGRDGEMLGYDEEGRWKTCVDGGHRSGMMVRARALVCYFMQLCLKHFIHQHTNL